MSNMLLNILLAIVLKLKTAATLITHFYTLHIFTLLHISFWQLYSATIIWHCKKFLRVNVET